MELYLLCSFVARSSLRLAFSCLFLSFSSASFLFFSLYSCLLIVLIYTARPHCRYASKHFIDPSCDFRLSPLGIIIYNLLQLSIHIPDIHVVVRVSQLDKSNTHYWCRLYSYPLYLMVLPLLNLMVLLPRSCSHPFRCLQDRCCD